MATRAKFNMDMSAIEIMVPGAAVAAIAAASFRLFSGRTVRLSSTSQELLDLFEETVPEQRIKPAPPASNDSSQSIACECGITRHQGLIARTRQPAQTGQPDSRGKRVPA